MRPELCQLHEGIARDMEANVTATTTPGLMAVSSNVKVGVTRWQCRRDDGSGRHQSHRFYENPQPVPSR